MVVLLMNILLCCAAGMSTSLLVRKMKRFALENEIDCHIWAIPAEAITRQIEKANVILLGPQVRFLLPEIKKLAEKKNIPVGVIKTVDYGIVNAEEVFRLAMKLVSDKR